MTNEDADLADEARTLLKKHRPRIIATGDVINTPQSAYGIHWFWGDRCLFEMAGYLLTVYIDAITVQVSGSGENIYATLRGEL